MKANKWFCFRKNHFYNGSRVGQMMTDKLSDWLTGQCTCTTL